MKKGEERLRDGENKGREGAGGDKARRAEQQRRNKIEFTTFTLRQRRRRRRRPLQPDAVGKKQQVGEEREYNQRRPVKRKRTFFCLVFLGEPPRTEKNNQTMESCSPTKAS